MKRSFLVALGLEKEVIDQIMSEHGTTIEATKEKGSEAQATLKETIATLTAEVATLKATPPAKPAVPPTPDTKQAEELAALQAEFTAYKDAAEKTKTEAQKLDLIKAQLLAGGANPKLVDLLVKEFDVAKIELEGDETAGFKPKDWENLLKPVKETYPDLFGTVTVTGAKVPTPPLGGKAGEEAPKTLMDALKEKYKGD